ncbi:pickpocket protein 28-like [Thrips palmi]|uniref:Pickpocket protein 28-like n=1 Tax=Thrips palmi TaxID=161013 RepID=A0A6P9AH71_THRPL|nr:pickpocket protein 28-like [Thrips palmi]
METAQQYCQSSSLHGLRYVGDTGISPVERCFWVVSFVLAVFMASYFINNIWERWEHSPVINSVAPVATPIFDIPFPAITICNMNRARRAEAEAIKSGSPRNSFNALQRRLLSDICDDTDYSTNVATGADEVDRNSGNWSVVMGFMINVTQPCHELLLSCKWRSLPVECDNLFNAVLTDEGICCSFNRVRRDLIFRNPRELSDLNITWPYPSADWTPETGYPEQDRSVLETPWRPVGIGTHLGLTITLDSELHDYYCSSTSSAGFKMLLHNPVETPKIAAFGALVEPGTENRVAITPVISHTASSLLAVTVAKRQCLFQHERRLYFYRTYTQRNCILECEANFTLSHCKCVAYYMPKDRFTRICGKRDEACANIAREAMELRMANPAANLTHLNITEVPSCQCLPGCSELSYVFTHSKSVFAPSYRPDAEVHSHHNRNYLLKNSAVIHFYFTETLFPSRYKGELFGFTEFLSNTGGILGLFLGFSFLSVVEMAYFISLRVYCSWTRNQKHLKTKDKLRRKVKLDDDEKPVAIIETIPYLQ